MSCLVYCGGLLNNPLLCPCPRTVLSAPRGVLFKPKSHTDYPLLRILPTCPNSLRAKLKTLQRRQGFSGFHPSAPPLTHASLAHWPPGFAFRCQGCPCFRPITSPGVFLGSSPHSDLQDDHKAPSAPESLRKVQDGVTTCQQGDIRLSIWGISSLSV